MRHRWVAALVALTLAMVGVGWWHDAPPAIAACHAFTVSVDPGRPTEGASVTVRVSRDGALNPSQIDVSTVDGTAKAGEDYTALKKTVSFSTELSQTFVIPITDDATAEGDETFKVHLSNPGGCQITPNYSVGPDATVTIADNDPPPAPATTASKAPPSPAPARTTTPATSTAASSPTPTTAGPAASSTVPASTAASSTSARSSTTAVDRPLAAEPTSDDNSSATTAIVIGLAVLLVVVGGAVAWLLTRSRRQRSS